MRTFLSSRRLALGLLLIGATACYSLEPMSTVPGPNAEARIRLTDLGAAMMAPTLGAGVTAVRGRVLAIDSASVRLSVVAATDRDGLEQTWTGEQVTIPRQHVSGFEKREVSPFRSTLVTIGIVAAMVAIGGALSGGSDGVFQAFGIPRGR